MRLAPRPVLCTYLPRSINNMESSWYWLDGSSASSAVAQYNSWQPALQCIYLHVYRLLALGQYVTTQLALQVYLHSLHSLLFGTLDDRRQWMIMMSNIGFNLNPQIISRTRIILCQTLSNLSNLFLLFENIALPIIFFCFIILYQNMDVFNINFYKKNQTFKI